MTLPNHIAGGIVFTGVFGAFLSVNILNSPGLIVMTCAAATVADIDVPSSLWGRTFKPISKAINRRFGHRTLTHSIFFILVFWGIVAGTCSLFKIEGPYPTVFILAYCSHIIFDMMTVQGVPIFYPYHRSPCVIPGDAKLRLRSSNPRSEIAVFGFFLISGIFLQPLMADGFWTSYNRLWGTMTHLQSEFEKSEDLLQVDYRYRKASTEHSGTGFAIECTGTIAILWNETTGWERLDASPTSDRVILEVVPTHTEKKFNLVRKSFVAISPDSLDRLITADLLYHIQLSGNEAFTVNYHTATDREKTSVRSIDLDLVEKLSVFEVPDEVIAANVKQHESPRIRSLEVSITQLKKKQKDQEAEARDLARRIQTLETIRDETTDLYEEQRATEQLAILDRESLEIEDVSAKIRVLQTQIAELRAADRISYEEKVTEARIKYQSSLSPALELTGIATFVTFTSPNE